LLGSVDIAFHRDDVFVRAGGAPLRAQPLVRGTELGFSLEEIGEILKMSRGGDAPCARVLDLAQRNLAAAEERIRQLQAFRDRLEDQIARWKDKTPATCMAGGLCEIITSADLPTKLTA